jgi:hypothetical protein
MSGVRETDHLPQRRAGGRSAPPEQLPRQRRGISPQMRTRYPEWDVLAETAHWDDATRRVVLARVDDVPVLRFFGAREEAALRAFCDVAIAQDGEPRIPVLEMVDDRLASGRGAGYRYADLPPDGELWRRVAAGLDGEAARRGASGFAELGDEDRLEVVGAFAGARLAGGAWDGLPLTRAWSVVMRDVLEAFYSHPWAWNEIGFAGPAYPRGYARLAPGQREAWEADEAFALDPVRDTAERGLP